MINKVIKSLSISGVLERFTIALTLALFCSAANAALIFFDPTPKIAAIGDSFTIDLVWDGSAGPEYIGDFDVDILFDDSIVSYDGATIDPDLGVDSFGCMPFITCDESETSPGVIDIFEVSLDPMFSPPDTLEDNQDFLGNLFRLASLDFTALADGITPLAFSTAPFGNTFGDESGNAISPDLSNGLICVGPNGCAAVPEPGSLALVGLGLLGLAGRRWRRMR